MWDVLQDRVLWQMIGFLEDPALRVSESIESILDHSPATQRESQSSDIIVETSFNQEKKPRIGLNNTFHTAMEKPDTSTRYDTIWTADDPERDEFLSETEVDERSLSSQEKHHQWRASTSCHHRILASVRRHRWIIDTSLLLLITGLLIVLLVRQSILAARLDGQGVAGTRQVGGDFSASNHPGESSF